jgi:CubicO group peptidase (beta-lactamase class C family)
MSSQVPGTVTGLLAADGLARFDQAAAAYVGSGAVPGLVALAARGDQVHAQALGSLSFGGPPVRRDSIFRIASITKPITGVATMALAAEGLLRLDEPVDRLLPELAGRRVLRRIDGHLVSTADDLLAFSRMLLRGGSPVLSADAVAELTRDQLTDEQKARGGLGDDFLDRYGWGYCLAVVTGGPDAGAAGWSGGFGSTWLIDPRRDLAVIVLTHRMFDSSSTPQPHLDLQAAAYSAAGVSLR